ncbi:MAG TPA: DUF1501 domain-containing protein [Planctomycetota bacterium]|nr:DUF1501 domain-containing protein [Planctomycetota bacterium]
MNDSCTKCPGGHYSPMRRRGFLQVGAVGAMGLTLADYFRMTARADDARTVSGNTAKEGQAKSVIQIFLPGGCPHQETWDPKPEAPVEYRGPLGVVKTKLPGVVFSEHLPKTAAIADKITVIRSIAGRIPDHAQASYHLLTGYLPTPAIQHPSMGAVVAQQFGPKNNLPPYVGVPNVQPAGGTGYLSSKYGAFEIGVDPAQKGFSVRDVSLPKNVDKDQFTRRKSAREAVEAHFKSLETDQTALDAMDSFYQRAYNLISSPEAQKAFTLDDEKQSTVDLYGGDMKDRNGNPTGIGRRLMMCRRLVEAGVRFVSVSYGGWDLHTNVKDGVSRQLPAFDHAFAGLIQDLDQRGLLDSTVVMVMSEFGRSPKVNVDAGRDHYSRCFSIACAGGGLTRGQIYGASNSTASEPDVDPVPVEDLLFTVYHQLGINADERLIAPGGRPIDIIRGGKLVKGLVAKA